MGLGTYPGVGLAEARRERDKWQAVLVSGTDPISERKRRAEDELASLTAQGPTLEELVATVFEARKASLRGDGKRGRWMSPLSIHILPRLGKRLVTEITQIDIRDTLAPIWRKKPATAEKCAQRLTIVFRAGKLSGLAVDPFTVDAACHLLGEVPHTATPIVATRWQDIPDLYRKLIAHPTTSHLCLCLIMLTAVRGDAARGARLEEFVGDVWTIPKDRIKGRAGKVEDFRVPINNDIKAIVDLCRETEVGGFLFPTRNHRGGYSPVSANATEKALNMLGEAGRPHGFRSSFRTWVQDNKITTFDVAETMLGHIVGTVVERSYARSDLLDERRIVGEQWASYVTGPHDGDEDVESTGEEARS